jgi:hypothetical protein
LASYSTASPTTNICGKKGDVPEGNIAAITAIRAVFKDASGQKTKAPGLSQSLQCAIVGHLRTLTGS